MYLIVHHFANKPPVTYGGCVCVLDDLMPSDTRQAWSSGNSTDLNLELNNSRKAPSDISSLSHLQKKPWYYGFQLLLASASWLAASSGIILINRVIMVELQWPYPMAVAALGIAVSTLFGFVVCDILHFVPPVTMDSHLYLTRVVPVGALSASALWLSNSLYLHLTVAFIEMCRALLPLFVMISLYIAGLELPTSSLIKAVILTCVGCMLAAYGEVNLNVVGLLCLIGNFTFEAGRLVLLQVLLVGHEFHPLQGLKLVGPAILTCLCLSSLVVEVPRMMKHKGIEIVLDNWPVFLVAATLGLCVNLISLLIIKMSGSTTLKILGIMRGPLVILSGVLLFKEVTTTLELLGYSIALSGFTWYNVSKAQQAAST